MPFVINCTNETQKIKVCGNWFEFSPNQTKYIKDDRIADFMTTDGSYLGLVLQPEEFAENPELKTTEEGKARLEEVKTAGLQNYINWLRWRIANNQISLRQDLEQANIKADPATFATEGELEAMRLLASYQKAKDDSAQRKADEVRKLMKEIGGVSK